MPKILLENVSAGYGELKTPVQRIKELVVNGGRGKPERLSIQRVSLELNSGESLAVLGDAQSGKRALVDVIAGRLRPAGGRGRIYGRAALVEPPESMLHMGSTIRENAMLYGRLRGYSREQIERRMDGVLWMAEAGEQKNRLIQDCEAAVQARLCFALAMSFEPDILLIDLTLEGLGLSFEKRCRARMKTLLNNGAIIVDAACTRSEARTLFQKALVLENGRAVSIGPAPRIAPAAFGARGDRIRLAKAETAGELSAELPGLEKQLGYSKNIAALLAVIYRLTGDLHRQKEREARMREELARASRSGWIRLHKGKNDPRDKE
ncbi:MAG: ATP-binding cassette domain-containing protein [Bacillota bacterium]